MKKAFVLVSSLLLLVPLTTSAAGIKTLNGLDTQNQLLSINANSHLQVSSSGSTHTFSWDGSAWAVNQGGTGLMNVPAHRILFGKDASSLDSSDKFTYDPATGSFRVGTATTTQPGTNRQFEFVTETSWNDPTINPMSFAVTNYNDNGPLGSQRGSSIVLEAARGTQAAPLALKQGDNLGKYSWSGFTGVAFRAGTGGAARMQATAAQDFTPTVRGTNVDLFVTAMNTITQLNRMHVGADGSMYFTNGINSGNFQPQPNFFDFVAETNVNTSNTPTVIRLDSYNTGDLGTQFGSAIGFRTARGTVASPTALKTNDVIGKFTFAGYDGTQFTTGNARISGVATEDWTAGARGTRLDFYTINNGEMNATRQMSLQPDGQVFLNTMRIVLGSGNGLHSVIHGNDTNTNATGDTLGLRGGNSTGGQGGDLFLSGGKDNNSNTTGYGHIVFLKHISQGDGVRFDLSNVSGVQDVSFPNHSGTIGVLENNDQCLAMKNANGDPVYITVDASNAIQVSTTCP